jgi:endo-alpha-1,4-polygalactosaminidase (GH114 family)
MTTMKTFAFLITAIVVVAFAQECGSGKNVASNGSTSTDVSTNNQPKDAPPIRLELSKDDQFLVYYDTWDANKIELVKNKFKIIILHPGDDGTMISAEQVQKLKNGGATKVFGYLSIGEDDTCSKDEFKSKDKKLQCAQEQLSYNDKLGPVTLKSGVRELEKNGYPSYLIDLDGDKEPDVNESWNSFYIDAENENWKKIVLERAGKVARLGVEGLFLDTLDTSENFTESQPGMLHLIREIKNTTFDGRQMILIANRGLFFFKKNHCEICNFVSAVMFENLFTSQCVTKKDDKDCKEDSSGIKARFLENGNGEALNDLKEVQVEYPQLQVLILEYVGRQQKKPPCKDLLKGTLEKLTKGITVAASNFTYDGRYPYYVAPSQLNVPDGGKSEDYFPVFSGNGRLDYANWCR